MMSTFSTVDQVRTNSASTSRRKTWAKPLAIGLVALVWLSTTFLLFRGYVGSDDVFYARYAFLFHRPPMNHWEFRIPAILAIRASFFALGPTEFAAALPTLLASLAILASVAWFVGWPSRLNWQTQIAMLLTATFPMDLGFRSIPGATYFSSGFLALGTVCLLKGRKPTQLLGAALLALGFATHEITIFYTAVLFLTALAFDRRRFWLPALACLLISGGYVMAECACYRVLLGDPLARFKASAAIATKLPFGYDPDTGIGGIRFFTWPVLERPGFQPRVRALPFRPARLGNCGLEDACQGAADSLRGGIPDVGLVGVRHNGSVDVQAVLSAGPRLWVRRVWDLRLLPATMSYVYAARRKLAWAVVAVAVAVHLSGFVIGGARAQSTRVSRQLLRYGKSIGTRNS